MELHVDNVCVTINKHTILHNICLRVEAGSFVSLLGASGCGKTTLLKSIAGLTDIASGSIVLNGMRINDLAAQKRGTVIIFQDLRLFPHMSVEKNIAFPLEIRGIARHEQPEIIHRLLTDVKLEGLEKRKIRELSGGQQQRVAIARALAADPKILLLDEPFSGLDEKLRIEMGALVKKLQQEHAVTMILVTHDSEEALRLSDKIALMKDGVIIQHGTPHELFYAPISKTAAEYFGTANYIRGAVQNGVFCSPYFSAACTYPDGVYDAMLRPYWIKPSAAEPRLFTVQSTVFTGEMIECRLVAPSLELIAECSAEWLTAQHITTGSKAGIAVDTKQLCLYPVE